MKNQSQQGFTLIELLIVVAIIGIIAAIAIPNLLASRRAANEASAISGLRTISSAEVAYRDSYGNGVNYGDMSQLAGRIILDTVFTAAQDPAHAKSGYYFAITVSPGAYVSGAAAVSTNTGKHRFSSDENGVIYFESTTPTVLPTATGGTPIYDN